MFENLSEVKKATVKQLIAIQTMNVVGCINWIDYDKDGNIIVNWEDGVAGMSKSYSVNKKGLLK